MKSLLTGLLLIALSSLTARADVQAVPEHARACCVVSGCSGVIVSRGPEWSRLLLARHCFGGAKLGQHFTAKFIDGSTCQATLLTTHRDYDLALMAVPSTSVIGVSQIAVGRHDRCRFEAVGWPSRCHGGTCRQELTYFYLLPAQQSVVTLQGEPGQFDKGSALRWAFTVENGGNTPGASGMPIFANGQVVGINSNNNGHQVGTISYCSTPEQTAEFMTLANRNGCDRWNLGEWSAAPVMLADAPPPLAYGSASNSPLKLAGINAPQVAPAPPPPGVGPEQRPPGPGPGPGPQFQHAESKALPDYDGKGKPPKGYRHPRERSALIIQLEHDRQRIADELAALHNRQPEKGEKGEPGEPGPPGEPAPPPIAVAQEPEPTGHPLVAVACFFSVTLFGFVFAFVRDVKKAHG